MQAQVEPHFLFNTLASVQYLTETDPRKQSTARASDRVSARGAAAACGRARRRSPGGRPRARRTSTSCACAWARGSSFAIDVPGDSRSHPFPPVLLDIARRERDQARDRACARAAARLPCARGARARRSSSRSRTRAAARRRRQSGGGGAWASPTSASAWPRCTAPQAQFSLERGVPARRARDDRDPARSGHRRADAANSAAARVASQGDGARCRPRSSPKTSRCCARSLRAAGGSLARARDRRRGAQRRGSAGALEQHEPDIDVPRHPHAREVGTRRRARAWRGVATSCSSRPTTNTRSRRSRKARSTTCSKPVTAERIAKVVDRLRAARRHAAARSHGAARAPRRARRRRALKWIRASLGSAMKLIAVDDVIYFQAEDKYTKVVTADGDALIRKPIKELFEELDPDAFWQIHRGTIVNLRAIAARRARQARPAGDPAQGPGREAHGVANVRVAVQGDVASGFSLCGKASACTERRA